MSAIFGPAGNAESFPYKSSVDAPRWLAELGLDCYEYQCGKGVNVREETARNIGAAAVAAGIRLSLHAPYFINLANPDPESLQKTIGYITAACQAADWMGAGRVVIHSGALMKRTRREALDIALRSLKAVIAACDDAGYGHIALCPETMGKINQLGDLDEVLETKMGICFDFSALMGALLRSQGIPTQMVMGYADITYHAWNNILIDGEWVRYDATSAVTFTKISQYTEEAVY